MSIDTCVRRAMCKTLIFLLNGTMGTMEQTSRHLPLLLACFQGSQREHSPKPSLRLSSLPQNSKLWGIFQVTLGLKFLGHLDSSPSLVVLVLSVLWVTSPAPGRGRDLTVKGKQLLPSILSSGPYGILKEGRDREHSELRCLEVISLST